MSRHSKRNTSTGFFTYHERRMLKDYGTQSIRVGRDSFKDLEACSLCLQPAIDPLVSKYGTLYCKGCICENLVQQKAEALRKVNEFAKAEKERKNEEVMKREKEKQKEIKQFETTEFSVGERKDKDEKEGNNISAFWVPHLTPGEEHGKQTDPPKMVTLDPIVGKPLKLRQLIPAKFTVSEEGGKSGTHERGRYQCPVCSRPLTNAVLVSLVRPCGHVICVSCIKKFVEKEMSCTVCGEKIQSKKKDLVRVKSGGTGFVSHNVGEMESKKYIPQMGFG